MTRDEAARVAELIKEYADKPPAADADLFSSVSMTVDEVAGAWAVTVRWTQGALSYDLLLPELVGLETTTPVTPEELAAQVYHSCLCEPHGSSGEQGDGRRWH